jgi:hypothetical protein
MRVRWKDTSGREFSVSVYGGDFDYAITPGDRIQRDYQGRVIQVGDVVIKYDYNSRVIRIGDVQIGYDYQRRVVQVGGLKIDYDYQNRVVGTRGSIN